MDRFEQVERWFRRLFETAGNIVLAAMTAGAPYLAPLAPATFFAHAIYSGSSLPPAWAGFAGVAAAAALESSGLVAAHQAISFYGQKDGRWQLAAAGVGGYLLIGITAILLLETEADIQVVGVSLFLLAAILYLMIGLSRADARETAAAEAEIDAITADNLAQREAEAREREAERKHALDLARIEAERDTGIAKAKAAAQSAAHANEAAQATQERRKTAQSAANMREYNCICGFKTHQANAISGHKRWCEQYQAHKASELSKNGA